MYFRTTVVMFSHRCFSRTHTVGIKDVEDKGSKFAWISMWKELLVDFLEFLEKKTEKKNMYLFIGLQLASGYVTNVRTEPGMFPEGKHNSPKVAGETSHEPKIRKKPVSAGLELTAMVFLSVSVVI